MNRNFILSDAEKKKKWTYVIYDQRKRMKMGSQPEFTIVLIFSPDVPKRQCQVRCQEIGHVPLNQLDKVC